MCPSVGEKLQKCMRRTFASARVVSSKRSPIFPGHTSKQSHYKFFKEEPRIKPVKLVEASYNSQDRWQLHEAGGFAQWWNCQ